MATVNWTKEQLASTKAGQSLFGEEPGSIEISRADKMRASRKLTNKLTSDAIEYLNGTGFFTVHRQNNIPSTRIANEEKQITGKLPNGQIVTITASVPTVHHKKNQIQFALLDIAGFTLPYKASNGELIGGIHVELEVKTGKDRLSKEQTERIQSIKKAGGISFAFNDMETLKMQISPYIPDRKLAF